MSTFVEDAMIRLAAETIAKDAIGITAEFFREGDAELVISLTEEPFAQVTLKVSKR